MSTSERPENSKPERQRRDWWIVFLILLLGFACVLVAGQYALRFAPSWQLDTDMESNIDLNSEFLTSRPVDFFEPLDPAILTQPGWVNGNVFLTPGAALSFADNGTPLPTSNSSTDVPTGIGTTAVATNATVVINTIAPTNTLVWIPIPATSTSKPDPLKTATHTSPPPVVNADLQVAQVIEVPSTTTYAAGTMLTYQVTVINNGPDAVSGAQVTANLPPQISTWNWACTPAVASCDGMNAAAPFNDIVNLPSGAAIVYTVTATIPAGVSGNLAFTVSITPPGGTTDAVANNSFSDTNTPGVDLVIVKSDGGLGNYSPNTVLPYTITVTNNSTFALSGVIVTDIFSAQIDSVSWTCALCPSSGTSNINDTINLPAGASVTYAVNAHISLSAMGLLENTASVTTPAGFTELDPTNNSSTDSDTDPALALNIGPPDGTWNNLGSGGTLTMVINPVIVANGDGAYDFVYYERIAPPPAVPPVTDPRVDMDWVQVQISSDGSTWYTVLYWGDGSSDANTNVALPAGPWCTAETDNCGIPLGSLYNSTGVAINIDGIVPIGNYPWIRITAPAGDSGSDGCDIDAIQILP